MSAFLGCGPSFLYVQKSALIEMLVFYVERGMTSYPFYGG